MYEAVTTRTIKGLRPQRAKKPKNDDAEAPIVAHLELTTMEKFIILRRRKCWTQDEAAQRLGVPRRTLMAWESLQRTPKPIVLREIERFVAHHINNK